jgi:hypothetical protein
LAVKPADTVNDFILIDLAFVVFTNFGEPEMREVYQPFFFNQFVQEEETLSLEHLLVSIITLEVRRHLQQHESQEDERVVDLFNRDLASGQLASQYWLDFSHFQVTGIHRIHFLVYRL